MKHSFIVKSNIYSRIFRLIVICGFLLAYLTFISGCKKENTTDPNEYYVKYEVNSSTIYYGGKLNVTINDENGSNKSFTIDQRVPWDVVIGPVEKGFEAEMLVQAIGNTQDKLKLYANLYVSKNNGPFALKESNGSDSPRNNAQLSYIIDF